MAFHRRAVLGLSIVGAIGFAPPASAFYSVSFLAGTTNNTDSLTGFGTTGDLMAGMDVTAHFADGSSESTTWTSLGFPAGNAVGADWSIFESGDTFGSHWILSNDTGKTMSRVVIDAGPGDTVFDTDSSIFGTPGSARGWTFEVVSDHSALDIMATYVDEVALTGDTPVGDLYRFLDIDFHATGLASGGDLRWISDTDNIAFAGDLTPIPEPSTLLVLSLGGLLGTAVRRRRQG